MKKYAIILVVVAIVAWLFFFRKKRLPDMTDGAATKLQPNPTVDNGGGVMENWLSPIQRFGEMPSTQAMEGYNGESGWDYRAYDPIDRCIDKCLKASGGSGAAYDKCVRGCAGLSANYTNHNDIWSTIAKGNQLNLIKLPDTGSVNIQL